MPHASELQGWAGLQISGVVGSKGECEDAVAAQGIPGWWKKPLLSGMARVRPRRCGICAVHHLLACGMRHERSGLRLSAGLRFNKLCFQ